MKTLVVVLGPTGVGKTELCIKLAQYLKSPIINADSRQIFAEIPIGTAAPTQEQQHAITHYFVGNHSIKDYYSAAKYETDALELMESLFHQGHETLLLTGGSMMYIDAVCNGIDDIPTVDQKTRDLLKKKLTEEGLDHLVEELKQLDPEHYFIVDKKNPRRVVHALEICYMTGKTYTSFRKQTKKQRPFKILKIGLNRDRNELYERINSRVIDMFNHGLIDECKHVYGYRDCNALNTVGYKETFNYINGLLTQEETIRQIQSNTRQYMRKQLTWFKRDQDINWFQPDNIEEIIKYLDEKL